jgi:hypothetical protein
MSNPYAAANRLTPKGQIQLGQSQLLKKIEKLQNKHSGKDIKTSIKTKKSAQISSYDISKDQDDDDSEDEDSVFKNFKNSSNKFMKKTQEIVPDKSEENDEVESDLEISADDRSSTPNQQRKSSQQQQHLSATKPINKRSLSVASTIDSYTPHHDHRQHRRSPSKVKFQDSNTINQSEKSDNESTIIEDMLSKNLVLSIDELEVASLVNQIPARKSSKNFMIEKRSESVNSIIEEDENLSSEMSSSSLSSSKPLRNTNLILDIDELEKGIILKDKKKNAAPAVPKRRVKTPTSVMETETDIKTYDEDDESIRTEIESTREEQIKTDTESIRTVRSATLGGPTTKSERTASRLKSYRDDFETSLDTTELSNSLRSSKNKSKNRRSLVSDSSKSEKTSKKDKKKKSKKSSTSKKRRSSSSSSSSSDSSSSLTSLTSNTTTITKISKKNKKNKKDKQKELKTTVEIQVDQTDLIKHTDLYKSVGMYPNPSSLVIASLSYLNDSTNLTELNQLTGYNLVNSAYTDLIKMNLNFFRNFLTVQRALYQQQLNSIQPK